MEENKEANSKKELSGLWIKNNVYFSLEKIEEHQRLMVTAFKDILEFIKSLGLTESQIVEIKIKNMELMISEMDILIENTKRIVTKKQYELVSKKIKLLNRLFYTGYLDDKDMGLPSNTRTDQINKTHRTELTSTFLILQRELIKMRSEMVDYLGHVLYIPQKDEDAI